MSPIATIPALFKPLRIGDVTLQNRIALAPLTRMRADKNHVHHSVAAEYYAQRGASPGTMLITEATFISARAGGYAYVPGIYNDKQVKAWKEVVDAVHAKGSFIYLQLWALGRAATESVLKEEPEGHFEVVSASDIPLADHATPRPLTEAEIKEWTADYALAAKRFVEEAGGDGVEIHGANGYLLDQFIQTNSNKRTDKYGGSVDNRLRFPLEVVKAVSDAIGEKKTGIRMSPWSAFQDMRMPCNSDIRETFSTYVKALKTNHPDLAFIHVVEPRVAGVNDIDQPQDEETDFLYDIWTPKPFLSAGGFSAQKAFDETEQRPNTVAVFGRYFISNPDLVERIRQKVEFTPYNRKTFYLLGPDKTEGYTDYPNTYTYKAPAIEVTA